MRQLKFVVVLLLAAVPARAAIVQLELYNTFELVDENDAFLLGTTGGGDLVQLILAAGPSPAPPSGTGGTTGGDLLMFTTHVGAGMAPAFWNQGLLDVFPINLDDSLVGQTFYVRFWNDNSPATATYYGNSDTFILPPADMLGQIYVDFVPTAGSLNKTIYPFEIMSVVPEPGLLLPFGLGVLSLYWLRRRKYSRD